MNSLTLIEKGRKLMLEIWNKIHDGKSITRAEINAFVTLRMMEGYKREKKALALEHKEELTDPEFNRDHDVAIARADHHALIEIWNVLGRPYQIYTSHVVEALEPKPPCKRKRSKR